MKLSRCSGGKPQNVEDRIVGGSLGLSPDPILYPSQSLRGLMDVVAVGDVDDRLDQLFETLVPGRDRAKGRRFVAASRNSDDGLVDLVHPIAFPSAFRLRSPKPARSRSVMPR
jgi:hypothetical protein